MKQYYVSIMASEARTLSVGVTNSLRRGCRSTNWEIPGFTQKYGLPRLVYYEETPDVLAAIAREKQIKGWLRRGRLH